MRILFAIPSLEPGGTERQLLYLLRALHTEHELAVLYTRRAGAWEADARAYAELNVLQSRGGWDFRQQTLALPILKQFRPDVVHTFLFGFDFWMNRAARAAGVPVVVSGRRQLARWKKARHVQLQRVSNRLVDAIVANSHAVAQFAANQEGRPLADYRVIPNAIDIAAFARQANMAALRRRYGIPREKRVVGMVANFSPVKNHALFLAVAGELLKTRSDLHFLLVGSGPLRETIRRKVAARGWADRFSLVSQPSPEELSGLYQMMDAHALTSHEEGSPNVLLEAMAAGTPVVAHAVGGVPELIEDGVTGSLVPAEDAAAFARAIAHTLDNGGRASERAAAAAARVRDRHTLSALASAHVALYTELLSAAGNRRLAG